MGTGISQLVSLTVTLTLFSVSSLHSGAWLGLAAQAGEHTGSAQEEHGSTGARTGARQPGHTGEVTRLGPVRAAASVRIISRARMSREATRPRPLPGTEATLMGRHLV